MSAAVAQDLRQQQPLTERAVLGVVVTYQPDPAFARNLEVLRQQLSAVVVVDNGSVNIAEIEATVARTGCRLIKNVSNMGISYALNQGAAIALAEGFSWLATFDQDSEATPGMLAGLLALYDRHPLKKDIGVLVAYHCDRATGDNYDNPTDVIQSQDDWRVLRTTITSGSLVSADALRAAGSFDEALFIDFVDHDFYMRCRREGFLIVGATRHALLHSIGSYTLHRLLWRRVVCSNHSALRRYYITRNQLEVYRRYLFFDPRWCARGFAHMVLGSAGVLVFESERLRKARAMAKGAWHFVTRRFGKLDNWQ